MSESASLPAGRHNFSDWWAAISKSLPTPALVGIGFVSLLPALITAGPVAAAVAIWYRGGGDHDSLPLLFAVMVVAAMFATSALSLGTAWRRGRLERSPAPSDAPNLADAQADPVV